jgi:hypothetical protein
MDCNKRGTKRSQLSEGHGLPRLTVDEAHPQHLCLGAGYDDPTVLEAAEERGYTVHVHLRQSGKRKR